MTASVDERRSAESVFSADHESVEFRRVLGYLPTGVAVVAGLDPSGTPVGLAVGSLTSASLTPPLMAFFVGVTSTSWPRIRESSGFCLNLLAHDQEPLSRAFAQQGGDKFDGVSWSFSRATRSPRIDLAHAWIDCRVEHEAVIGDHVLVVGKVLDIEASGNSGGPLVFYRRGYHGVREL